MNIRNLWQTACCLAALAVLLGPMLREARAASWPPPKLGITLPFSAGNGAALLAELQAGILNRQYGTEVSLRFMPGRGGVNAWANINTAVTDGSTLTAVELPGLLLRADQRENGINLANLRICHLSARAPVALWAPLDSPITDLDAFASAARDLTGAMLVAGPGSLTPAALASRRLDRLLGIQTVYSPYMGTLEAAAAFVEDPRIKALWADALAYPELIGKFRPIAVAGEGRAAPFPQTPTFRELGYDLVRYNYRGYVLSAGTPEPMILAVYLTLEEVRKDPGFSGAASAIGFDLPEIPLVDLAGLAAALGDEAREEAVNLDILPPAALP